MKKLLLLTPLFLLVSLMIISGCQKETISVDAVENETMTQSLEAPDKNIDPQAMIIAVPGGPVIAVPRRPDLVVASYTTNVAGTTGVCGGSLPNVSCAGGMRNFLATATIMNIGNSPLPAGNISVSWFDITLNSTQVQTVPHPGIAVGGVFAVTRPYYMGPCDCVPPGGNYFTHSFNATVDPANLIAELSETNNVSATYTACDGC